MITGTAIVGSEVLSAEVLRFLLEALGDFLRPESNVPEMALHTQLLDRLTKSHYGSGEDEATLTVAVEEAMWWMLRVEVIDIGTIDVDGLYDVIIRGRRFSNPPSPNDIISPLL